MKDLLLLVIYLINHKDKSNYLGATLPFGMVQLSPDIRETLDRVQASGYYYNDSTVCSFSYTRLSGTGALGLIDLLLPIQYSK